MCVGVHIPIRLKTHRRSDVVCYTCPPQSVYGAHIKVGLTLELVDI